MTESVQRANRRPLRLLMVEDSESDAHLLALELERGGYALTWTRVDTPEAMRAALEREPWEVITSDHSMPHFSAPAALALARELCPETPFIIVSGEIDLRLAVSLMKAGAHDYIQKHELIRVAPSIERELEEMELRRQNRRAEEERRLSEEKFYKAFHNSPDAINLNRLSDGMYLAVNKGFEHLTGYTATEAIGQSTLTLNIWANPADRVRLAASLLENGEFNNEEILARLRTGETVPALISARLITVNGETCVLSTSRNISAQKKAEEEIRRYNRELQAVSQIITAVTTQLALTPLLEEALRGAISLTGLESGAAYLLNSVEHKLEFVTAYNLPETRPPQSIPLGEGICGQAAATGRPQIWRAESDAPQSAQDVKVQAAFPLLIQNRVTGVLYLAAQQPVVFSEHGQTLVQQLCGPVALALENARLYETIHRYAEELEEHVAERTAQLTAINQELEAFSYSIAHDLRAPLRAIEGYSQILLEDYPRQLDAVGQQHLDRITASVQQMHHLIDDLLTLFRLTQGEISRQPISLSALARAIAEELQTREPERQVDWVIAEGLFAQGDPPLLRVVLENLLGNAWKFTAPTAHPRIEFGQHPSPTVPPETIYVVRDNGVGFDPAQAQHLFQVFRRLHSVNDFPGHGLGLASVRRIVRRHGGRIWAEGEIGQGAAFYFTLE